MRAWQTHDLSHACACNSVRKCDVWGVVFTPSVGCSRLLSPVNDLTATNQKILKVDTSVVCVKKRHNGSPRSIMLLFTWAQLRTFLLIVMSSTRNRSTATKMCWMKKTMDAIAGISRKESVRVVLLQTLGEDGVIWSTLRWTQNEDSWWRRCNLVNASLNSERFLIGPFFPDSLREIHQFFLYRKYSSSVIRKVKSFCTSLSIWMQTSSVRSMLIWDSRSMESFWKRSWIPSNTLLMHLSLKLCAIWWCLCSSVFP